VNDDLANNVMDYLTPHRTASLGNIAAHCNCAVDELGPVIEALEAERRLRLAFSRCQSGCSQCAGCESDSIATVLTDRKIVISLEQTERML
jgi:hypothetical protein